MKPTLFTLELFGRELPYHSYGAMLALGFLVGIIIAMLNGKKEGVKGEHIINLSLLIIVSAIVGSHLLHILMAEDAGGGSPLGFAGGGFAFYGGYIAAVAVSIAYCRRKAIPFMKMADTMTPSIALGLAFGRSGCTLAGCCWGRPINKPLPDWALSIVDFDWPQSLAIRFLHPEALAPKGVYLVPTELLLGLGGIVVFLILQFVIRPRKAWTGQLFAWFLVLYALERSFWETFRGDPRGMYFNELVSTSQLVSVPILALGIWLIVHQRRKARAAPPEPSAG